MFEWLLPLLLGLAVVLAVVTVVGHGIWVLIGTIFDRTSPGAPTAGSRSLCPRCSGRIYLGHCVICNWPGDVIPRDRTLQSLENTRQQIERYIWFQLLDKSVGDEVLQSLEAERQKYL